MYEYFARSGRVPKILQRHTNCLGIDPGQKGGIALVNYAGAIIQHFKFVNRTEHEIGEFVRQSCADNWPIRAAVEKVHSMPKQGVSSSFKFGMGYGFVRGLLVAHQIPFVEVTPQAWQKALGCLTKGDKSVSRRAAHRRWPTFASMIDDHIADSLLIAEWLRVSGAL
jgi:crossover junction endodeoxyribonuclease RuvC